MACCKGNSGEERVVVLSFGYEELLYDIRNNCYIEGELLEDEQGGTHRRHMTQDVGEGGNADRVKRVLDVGIARCRELLYPYTKYEVESEYMNDRLHYHGAYGVVMRLPEDFSETTLSYLERLIHEYLVCRATGDWLSITEPGKAQGWLAKAEEAEREIEVITSNRRGRPLLRRMHPF